MIFVFGSNLDGNHAGGAAAVARDEFAAQMGVGEGITGHAYAIPTVGHDFRKIELRHVRIHVERFMHFANGYVRIFQVTRIGCGIAGFKDEDIAPMFEDAPFNCLFDKKWQLWLPDKQFWGSF
jgi:hypothetical protein